MGDGGKCFGGDDAQDNPDLAADGTEREGLDQELPQNVARAGAHRHPDADFASPFGDADQHDVHNSDTADDQRNTGDGAQQNGHGARRRGGQFADLKLAAHGEVVLFAGIEAVTAPEQFDNLSLDLGKGLGAGGLDIDPTQIGLLANDPFHGTGIRNDDVIILIVAS